MIDGVFIINAILLLFLVGMAFAIHRSRNLFTSIILLGIYSLVFATTFVGLDAVDVAFTEAAVGAGISSILMLCTLALITQAHNMEDKQEKVAPFSWPAFLLTLLTGSLLLYSTIDMPNFGSADAPIHTHIAPRFIHDSPKEVGLPNLVTSVLGSYRGYDTMGETLVIFIAGVAVFSLLGKMRRRKNKPALKQTVHPENDIILIALAKLFIPLIILFGLYVQFHGDFGPGGGFQAGVIIAAGFIFHGLIFGVSITMKVLPPNWVRSLMALGMSLYAGTGVVTLILGHQFLDYSALAHGTHGQHYGIFTIELGVGITVAAVMISMFYSFMNFKPRNSKMKPISRGEQ